MNTDINLLIHQVSIILLWSTLQLFYGITTEQYSQYMLRVFSVLQWPRESAIHKTMIALKNLWGGSNI
jgi:uncharacterized protein YhhL (DUF1145 family)